MTVKKLKEVLIVGSVIVLIFMFIYGLGDALVPLVFSSFLAYASLPIVKKLEKYKFSRTQATLTVLSGVLLILTLLLLVAIPPLIEELRSAIASTPGNLSLALGKIDALLSEYGVHVPYDRDSLIAFFSEYSQKLSSEVLKSGADWIKSSLSNFASVIVSLLGFTMVPVFFFYVIKDYETITQTITRIAPRSVQPKVNAVLIKTDKIMSGYVRGQLLVCFILSVLYTLSLYIVGVKFALVIGIATGLLSIIPYVGFGLGFAAAIISVLANNDSWFTLLSLIGAYLTVQFIESFIITPQIVGDQVGLSPFEAILALIIFGNFFGFLGLLLAIPTGAVLKSIVVMICHTYVETEFYRGPSPGL